jgi:hypothetical protein
MKITVISQWYNEELLAPLFFNHYRYADEIVILLENDTNDSTREICRQYFLQGCNITLWDVHCLDGFDDTDKTKNINRSISSVKEGWIYVVDADEFIFPEWHEDPQTFLARQTEDIVMALNFHVYRHITEKDIDYTKDPVPQRVHAYGRGKNFKDYFIKPSVFRASAKVALTIGNHGYVGEHSISTERYIGAHWKQADLELCVRRRLSNGKRQSKANHRKGYGNHDYHITEERLKVQLEMNSNLPELKCFTERKEV